jgi:hypothetical protein
MQAQTPKELILLVGGNPLPNYVAACALREKLDVQQVRLFYTTQVENVKNNLKKCLEGSGFRCCESLIEDAASAERIRHACRDLAPGSHLHYTGGTNTMAVHIHAEWKKKNGIEDQASYLYGQDDRLLTDAGTAIEMKAVLDLDTLATLHGLEDTTSSQPRADGPSSEDAKEIATRSLDGQRIDDRTLADRLYLAVPPKEKKFRKSPLQPSLHGLALSEQIVPGEGNGWVDDERVKTWSKFLRGGWLEEWVALQIQTLRTEGKVTFDHLYVGVESWIKGRSFELDVVVIRGHRLYVASCTIDHDIRLCKSKLFEVAMRARQLGGDLARAALVCLADKDKEGKNIIDELQKDVHTLSVAQREPKVFGLQHLRTWAGWRGSQPNLTSLIHWLTDKS